MSEPTLLTPPASEDVAAFRPAEQAGRRLRVLVAGLRAPEAEGGIESHARHLYPLLAGLGCEIEMVVRRRYHPRSKPDRWGPIALKPIWSPRSAGLEAFAHTFLATLYAIRTRPDVFHIHAVGPALFSFLARLFGLKVVITHHGPDYDREKWGPFGRTVLRLGEWLGMRCAHGRIAISSTIRNLVRDKHGVECALIPNGVHLPPPTGTTRVLDALGLTPRRYVVQVSRFVPEKRQVDLIHAFTSSGLGDDWRLVLIGDLPTDNRYAQTTCALARSDDRIILTGFRTGEELSELCQNAALFVLPSSHEGLPIALLEALSYGLPVLASAIPANLEVGLPHDCYFPLGNVEVLAEKLGTALEQWDQEQAWRRQAWVLERYDWDVIARQTLHLYRTTMGTGDAADSQMLTEPVVAPLRAARRNKRRE